MAGPAGGRCGRGRGDGATGREGAAGEGDLADVQVAGLVGRLAPRAEAAENVHLVPCMWCVEFDARVLVEAMKGARVYILGRSIYTELLWCTAGEWRISRQTRATVLLLGCE